jgi:hypothetical protein
LGLVAHTRQAILHHVPAPDLARIEQALDAVLAEPTRA